MTNKILVVGGYGSVGRAISTALGELFSGRVLAAGRNYHKAEELSLETHGKVLPLEVDIFSIQDSPRILDDIALVVMCVDQRDTEFVRSCLARGINYIDISASFEFLSKIEALDGTARSSGATAVLSVGLAPGLTNLLSAYCKSRLEDLKRLDIFIMLGLGEAHGEAAIRWTIENLNSEFYVKEDGKTKRVRSFEHGKQTVFPGRVGRRTAYRFNFSDQHVIPKTLEVDSAATWLCFDSALVTRLFWVLKRAGVMKVLRFAWAREFLVSLFRVIHIGSDRFILKVDARAGVNGDPGTYECSISGRSEGLSTALVATEVAKSIYTSSFPAGVYHIEQLFEPLEFMQKLENQGLEFLS